MPKLAPIPDSWMRRFVLQLAFVVLLAGPTAVFAQNSEATPLELSESGQSYLETVGRRVDSNVVYYNPRRDAPELNTRARLPQQDRNGSEVNAPLNRHFFTAVAILILAGVCYHIWRFGSPVSVSLTSRPSEAARAMRVSDPGGDEPDATPLALTEILALDNWNVALVELARTALAQAAEQNGMRWQTSWTARDLLRRLPREVADGLRPLVWTAEHVQFGNRTVGEAEFARYAHDITPLLKGGAT